jgi:hypothetical protein
MKDLFDPTVLESTKQRIRGLHAESERRWGPMPIAQALAHCTSGIHMAIGTIHPKRAPFPASLVGLMIKPLVFRDDKPMRRHSPSSPELFPAHPTGLHFASEQARLIAALDHFATQGPHGCTENPHPFFGSVKPHQWAILMYKHLDHHLRQFGA